MNAPTHENRLIHETSPYLLQHAHNPVDWYPWGPEALQRARREDKPILLSIGYSACHWCHVMERESFENETIATLMNKNFVCIKVDREERPDLDSIYMQAVQAISGHGGWPMTVFLTPDGTPFYGGTYYPPEDRSQMPGFPRVLATMAHYYQQKRGDVENNATQIRGMLQQRTTPARSGEVDASILESATSLLLKGVDRENGGFGGAPKFPGGMTLEFLLRSYRRSGDEDTLQAVELSLEKMAYGGIYDQLGGGFHRYSVDAHWLVPHFEKMLYDNALLSRLYLNAYQVTGKPLYRRIVEETLDYVQREMTDSSGGFYSTQDADSEGVEGKFFLWTPEEVAAVLGPADARLFCRFYDVSGLGNFEEKNILHIPRKPEEVAHEQGISVEELNALLSRARPKLFAAREERVHPGRDEKVLTAWNGMMLRSFAEAARVLNRADYHRTALNNATFLLEKMRQEGRLLRTYKAGQSKLNGYLEDYAAVADALLAVYEMGFEVRWITETRALVERALEQFSDPENGGFFDTSNDHEALVSRPKDFFDNATPSGSSMLVDTLLRLGALTGEQRYTERALAVLKQFGKAMAQAPSAFGRLLCALDFVLGAPKEIAIVGDPEAPDTRALLDTIFGTYRPNKVVALKTPDDETAGEQLALLADRGARGGKATAYVCEHFTCQAPVTDAIALARQLGG